MHLADPQANLEQRFAAQAERLRQREHDLQAILDTMSAMVGYWDRDLRNRFGNHAYRDWFGIDPATMPGMHIREVIGEERYRLNLPHIQAALRGERQQFERAIPSPDGSRMRYSLAEYIPDIRDGEVQGFFVLVSDVTRLKEAELALRDSEARFRRLFEETAEAALLWQGGVFVDANAAAARLLRLPGRDAARGLGFIDLARPQQPDGRASAEIVAQMLAEAVGGGSRLFEWECRRADGEVFTAEVLLTAIEHAGGLVHVVVRDISAAKAAEIELRRSNAELEAFAYVASHDLRQPLRMIASYLTLLARRLRGGLDDEARAYLGVAVDGARRLDAMIVALLDYARIGVHGHVPETVGLAAPLARALASLEAALAEAGGIVELPEPLPKVHGVAGELERLFQNLLGNALKFRHPDRPLRVVVSCREEPRAWVVSVADNGLGIPADQRDQLFSLFRRVARAVEIEGTGIGLASCRKIAERHGGRIWVESVDGSGSTFHVALPKGGGGA